VTAVQTEKQTALRLVTTGIAVHGDLYRGRNLVFGGALCVDSETLFVELLAMHQLVGAYPPCGRYVAP
jgi:hypothetical protein